MQDTLSGCEQTFRHNVKAMLDVRDMSQQALADAIGCSRSNISRLLNGDEGVTIERADKIAKAVGMPLSVLLGEKIRNQPS